MTINNKKLIESYMDFRRKAEDISEQTIETQSTYLRMMDNKLKKSFKSITEKDILDYINEFKTSTRDTYIAILRKFMRWLYNQELKEPKYNKHNLPGCIQNIKTSKRNKNNDIEYRERVITEEEYKRMQDNTYNLMHKAMIETLWIYGVRVSELLSMNANDVSYDGQFTRIIVRDSKTQPREVPYNGRLNNLMKYAESYQKYKDQKEKPLWVGRGGERFSRRGMLNLISRISERANMDRTVNNHDFRHTSISRDRANGVPLSHIETKHGLIHGSLMMQRYDHNKSADYERWLSKKEKITPPSYDALKKKTEKIEELEEKIADLKNQMSHKTEIDNFVMDSLGLIAKEMIQNQGIESIKEIFRKHNVPLAKD